MSRLNPEQYANGLQRRARAMYAAQHPGGAHVHAEGVIVGYVDVPSYQIVTDEGRTVPWRCDLTDVGAKVSDEEYFRHANARRIRDGRASVRPEFKGELPIVRTGMSLAEIVDKVIAAGYDLDKVSIEYYGCGSHEIKLDEDVRSPEEIEAEVAEVHRDEERSRVRKAEYDRRMAEAEAIDTDPTRGW